jgi:hypothetical protein
MLSRSNRVTTELTFGILKQWQDRQCHNKPKKKHLPTLSGSKLLSDHTYSFPEDLEGDGKDLSQFRTYPCKQTLGAMSQQFRSILCKKEPEPQLQQKLLRNYFSTNPIIPTRNPPLSKITNSQRCSGTQEVVVSIILLRIQGYICESR